MNAEPSLFDDPNGEPGYTDDGEPLATLEQNIAEAYRLLGLITGRNIEPPKAAETGICGDCEQEHGLFSFGRVRICFRCLERRRGAATLLEVGDDGLPTKTPRADREVAA